MGDVDLASTAATSASLIAPTWKAPTLTYAVSGVVTGAYGAPASPTAGIALLIRSGPHQL